MNSAKNLLLVEDEAITAMAQAHRLQHEGYNVVVAYDSEMALEIIKSGVYKFNLILMDIDLGSGLNGIQTADIIIAGYQIPVLFLTLNSDIRIIREAKSVSPYGYFLKSTNHSLLVEAIEMAMELGEVLMLQNLSIEHKNLRL